RIAALARKAVDEPSTAGRSRSARRDLAPPSLAGRGEAKATGSRLPGRRLRRGRGSAHPGRRAGLRGSPPTGWWPDCLLERLPLHPDEDEGDQARDEGAAA